MAGTPRDVMSVRADERALVRGMIMGERAAFERFCDDYIPSMYRFVSFRLNHDRELTREIVQSTLVKAISKISTFRGESSLTTWLHACCKTEIAAHFRRGGSRPEEVELTDERADDSSPLNRTPLDGPERSALRRETSAMVHAALDALPPRYGRILEWKYLEDLPVKEIANRMRIGPKAAESLLTRARNTFRKSFARLQKEPRHEAE
jgi:RNA polymerase sigma-70 factor (ECF subfamily)